MFLIKTNNQQRINDTKSITFVVNKNVAQLQLEKKNGSTVTAKIDAEDLQKVLDAGNWFAEWNKNSNSYLAQHYIEKEGYRGKESLHAFILQESPKAAIKHFNGDTLDNRKANLEVLDKNSYNDYKELDSDTIAVILRDSKGNESGSTIIDKDDLYRVMNNGFPWVYYKKNNRPHAVANTPGGRLYLDRFIMNTPEEFTVHHINLNTLDNRKNNLENIHKSDD